MKLRHLFNFVFFPVLALGFVFDIFQSFFEYGQYLSTRWLRDVMRDPDARGKAEAAALAKAKEMFPGAKVTLDRDSGAVVVESADAPAASDQETKH